MEQKTKEQGHRASVLSLHLRQQQQQQQQEGGKGEEEEEEEEEARRPKSGDANPSKNSKI